MTEEKPTEQELEAKPISLNVLPPVANPLIPRLVDICLNTVIDNFTVCNKLHLVPRKYQTKILSKLSLKIDLAKAVMMIPDGIYWKRLVQANFPKAPHDPKMTEWKRFYLEQYASKAIEDSTEATIDSLFDTMAVIGPFIRALKIVRCPCKVSMAKLFRNFRCLRKLQLVYGDPRQSFAQYDAFDKFAIQDEMSAGVKDCNLLREDFAQIGSFCALQEFEMSDNCLTDKCAQIIGFGLVHLKQLTTINFAHNEIGNKGFNNIVQCCKIAPIRVINVSDNRIGGTGVQSLAAVLEKNSTLEELNLSSNKLGDKGMFGITLILEKSTTLKKLDISGNRIEHAGNFCEALTKNQSLTVLSLAANPFVHEDLLAISRTIDQLKNSDECRFEDIDLRAYVTDENDYIIKTTETSEAPLLRIP
jgi:hypothetical protein